jgi:hypothetical protein
MPRVVEGRGWGGDWGLKVGVSGSTGWGGTGSEGTGWGGTGSGGTGWGGRLVVILISVEFRSRWAMPARKMNSQKVWLRLG